MGVRRFGAAMLLASGCALVACGGGGGGGSTPPPPPGSPLPVPTLNPASLKLGGLDPRTCPSPLPDKTVCSFGFNAFPVDSSTNAAGVRFDAPGQSAGYAVSAANPGLVSVVQPVKNPSDGTEIFGVYPLAVGQTSVTLTVPGGGSTTLPVFVTSLKLVIDATRIPGASMEVDVAYSSGSSGGAFPVLGGPGLHTAGGVATGATYTVLNAPAYMAFGAVPNNNDLTKIVYGFAPTNAVEVHVREATRSYTSITPVSIADGQSNTVTVAVTPAP